MCFLMWVKHHTLCMLIDICSVSISYLMAFMAFYGSAPRETEWYGLFLVAGIYFLSSLFPEKKNPPEESGSRLRKLF